MVAQARGAEFGWSGHYRYGKTLNDRNICDRAIRDVATWLGFGSADKDGAEYLETLQRERRAIFKRASRRSAR